MRVIKFADVSSDVAGALTTTSLIDSSATTTPDSTSVVVGPSLVAKSVFAGILVAVGSHIAIRLLEGLMGWKKD